MDISNKSILYYLWLNKRERVLKRDLHNAQRNLYAVEKTRHRGPYKDALQETILDLRKQMEKVLEAIEKFEGSYVLKK